MTHIYPGSNILLTLSSIETAHRENSKIVIHTNPNKTGISLRECFREFITLLYPTDQIEYYIDASKLWEFDHFMECISDLYSVLGDVPNIKIISSMQDCSKETVLTTIENNFPCLSQLITIR